MNIPLLGRRSGLRARLVYLLAFGGLALSVLLALLIYGITQSNLTTQRENTGVRQAYSNARLIRAALRAQGTDEKTALDSLDLPAESAVVLERDGQWFSSTVGIGEGQVPKALRELVADGNPGRQRVDVLGQPRLVVGVPIPSEDVQYYEFQSLEELADSINNIRLTVFGAAALTTILSGVLGIWAGRRVARPVEEVSSAAKKIAGGDLSARLDSRGDRDLETLTRSFNAMVDALQQRIERDARFVADVSHELRSPVTTLTTAAELLQANKGDMSERDQRALDLLVAEVGRFKRVIEELLELSRSDASANELMLEPINVAELLTGLVDSDECTFEFDTVIRNQLVMLDRRRIERALVNVLDNARVHGQGVVAVGARRSDKTLIITVDDEGPGVPVHEREQVFDRFFRGAAAGRRGSETGAGLGLSLVREHVQLHGGRVWVDEPPSKRGTRIVMELPWRSS